MLAAAALALPAHAVQMKSTIGFDGVMKSFVWTPVAVELNNDSDDDLEGTIRVIQQDVDLPYLADCSARVRLPAHSKKLFHSYVRLAGYGGKVDVVFSRGGSVYAVKTTNINMFQKNDALVVSIGGPATRLNYLNNETIPAIARRNLGPGAYPNPPGSPGGTSAIHVGSISFRQIPDRPSAYEGVDMLVLSELTPSSANAKALRALAMWVASGGTLVIPTGPDYRRFQNEFYDDLLPVTINGSATLPGLTALGKMSSSPFPAGPASVAKSSVKPGIGLVLAAESGVPLMAARHYGAGQVIFLAFDHLASPFKDWNGQTAFWKRVVSTSVASERLARSVMAEMDDSMLNRGSGYYGGGGQTAYWLQNSGLMTTLVTQNPKVRVPSINIIGLFLLAYLVMLVPVNYFVLKRRRRLEFAWLTTPAIVLVFTVGAYAIGHTMKGSDLRLREVTMIEATSGSRCAASVTNASLFSPARRSYDLQASDQFALAQVVPMSGTDRVPDGFIDEASDRCSVEDVDMAMWSSKTFEASGGVDLGGAFGSSLALSGQHLKGTITNDTKMPLEDCYVCFAGIAKKIGNLPSGGRSAVDVVVASGNHSGNPFRVGAVGSQVNDDLQQQLDAYSADVALGVGSPVLIGRPARQQSAFAISRRGASCETAACCLVRLGHRASSSSVIRPSIYNINVLRRNNCADPRPDPQRGTVSFTSWGSGDLIVEIGARMPLGSSVTAIAVTHRLSNQSALSFSVWDNKSGKWVRLPAGNGRDGLDPKRYLNADGFVKIRAVGPSGRPAQVSATIGVQATGVGS